jgi:ABC-type multidrug transport system fused ATPase/permease subunit
MFGPTYTFWANLTLFSLQYAGRITDELISVVENFTWVGSQCVGIEKVCDYIDLEAEEPPEVEAAALAPPPGWPSAGKMLLRDVKLTYRPGLEPALKGISCAIDAGEHIGIVGRTGAGKSSLTLAILRMADEVTGLVEIDGVDTSKISRRTLRQKVAIIPQVAAGRRVI